MLSGGSSPTNKAIFFIFLLLSGEAHAARMQHRKRSGLNNKSNGTSVSSKMESTSLAARSVAEVSGNPEDPGLLESLGYYGRLGENRTAFLRSKVTDEILRKALVYSVCVRVAPAGHNSKNGYTPYASWEVRCSDDLEMMGAQPHKYAFNAFTKVHKNKYFFKMKTRRSHYLKPISKSSDEDSWVKSDFAAWDEARKVFPRHLSIGPKNPDPDPDPKNGTRQKDWPPYTPKMENRFMLCFGDVFQTRSWQDCTGFWRFKKVSLLVNHLSKKFHAKNANRLLDEIRAKALYPGSSSMDPLVVAEHTQKELGVVSMVVPLVRKAINAAGIEIKMDDAKDLGLDVRPLTEYTSQADVEGIAPPFKSAKNLVDIFDDITGKESSSVHQDMHCIAPKSNAVPACEILCNSMDGCKGFNFHSDNSACCFFGAEDGQDMQVDAAPGVTLFLPPSPSHGSSLLETKIPPLVVIEALALNLASHLTPTIAASCVGSLCSAGVTTIAGGVKVLGDYTLVVGGVAFPPLFIALGTMILGLLTFRAIKKWVKKKQLASKMKKFAALMNPENSIVTIKDRVEYGDDILPENPTADEEPEIPGEEPDKQPSKAAHEEPDFDEGDDRVEYGDDILPENSIVDEEPEISGEEPDKEPNKAAEEEPDNDEDFDPDGEDDE